MATWPSSTATGADPLADPVLHRLEAPPGAGRLDRWLAEELPLSRSRIQALVRQERVTVDGEPARPSSTLRGGEQVEVRVPAPEPSTLVGEAIAVPILYQDEHLVVIDKPAGLVVHPAKGHPSGTLVNALLHLLRQAGGDPARPGIVHRLDKGTSGTMVVARTPQAHQALAAAFAEHDLDRRYLALVWGRPDRASGTVDAPLARHPRDRKRFAVVEGGKRSITHWRCHATAALPVPGSRSGGLVSLVECRLETGRTHQVRVHLTHLGHPLLGDPTYRRRVRLPPALAPLLAALDHPLLHAWRLGFRHPISGEGLAFSTVPPADFLEIMSACGLDLPRPPGQDRGDRDTHARPSSTRHAGAPAPEPGGHSRKKP